jgi:hypothetical protein
MYISPEQIRESLHHLQWVHPFYGIVFPALKQAELPIGVRERVVTSRVVDGIMQRYFKPATDYNGYYQPFQSSNPQERWVTPRYPSTSIQRITADTFGDVFLHDKKSQDWGWRTDYVQQLQHRLDGQLIPAFHLAIWYFRDMEWPASVEPSDVVRQLVEIYKFTSEEITTLFDMEANSVGEYWIRDHPVSEPELLEILGLPPGSKPTHGAILQELEIIEVGPVRRLVYAPSARINLVTGNNSLVGHHE